MKKINLKVLLVIFTVILAISITLTALITRIIIVSAESEYSQIDQMINIIEGQYYTDTKKETLLNGALEGMVNSLDDPYSTYLTADESKDFMGMLNNEFVGIGVAIEAHEEVIVITKVFDDSPAMKSGLMVGDIFSKVDDKSVEGLSTDELGAKIRGEAGTNVKVEVIRGEVDNVIAFDITRDKVVLVDLEYKMLDDKVGYIDINDFTGDIYDQFSNAYDDLVNQGMEKLIIDVRDNGGGYLDQVVKIIDIFVDDKKPIYQEKSTKFNTKKVYGDSKKVDTEVAVLINKNSASASELLAASLNEINGSKLVGEKSFGKGTAQTTKKLKDDAMVKITFAQWLTPNGNWIHKVGINPTIKQEQSDVFSFQNIVVSDTIKVDTVSSQVKNAQQILNILEYKVRVDGYFDVKTSESISDFQTKNNLSVNGNLDIETANKLNEKLKEYVENYKNDLVIDKAVKELNDE